MPLLEVVKLSTPKITQKSKHAHGIASLVLRPNGTAERQGNLTLQGERQRHDFAIERVGGQEGHQGKSAARVQA